MSSVKDRISMFEKSSEKEQIEIKRKSDHPVQTNRAIFQKFIDTAIEKSPEQRAALVPAPFDITGDFTPLERAVTPPAQWTPPSKREMKSPQQQPLNKKVVFSPKLNPTELSSTEPVKSAPPMASKDEPNVVKEVIPLREEAKPREVKIEPLVVPVREEAKPREVKSEPLVVPVREEAKPKEVKSEAPVPVKEQVQEIVMELPVRVIEEVKDEPVETKLEEVMVEREEMRLEEVKPEAVELRAESMPEKEEAYAVSAPVTVPVGKPRVVLNGESTHVVGQVGDGVMPVATFEETDEPMTPKQAMDSVIVTLNAEGPVESVPLEAVTASPEVVVTAPMPEQVMETVKEMNAGGEIDHSTVLDKPLFPKPPLFTE